MPNIFNADNGVVSGSAGIKLSSDTSGVLNIQTNGTTAISISASQVVSFPSTTSIGTLYFAAGTAAAPSISVTGDTNTGIYFPAADTIAFTEGGVESARFDSAGNFGLGVTPSAWWSSANIFQSNGYTFEGRSGTPDYSAYWTNARLNTAGDTFIYRANGFATGYRQTSGQHVWFNSPSGTAGNAISFTQAMTLDASGNLGIGTTSPGARMDSVTSLAAVRGAVAEGSMIFRQFNNSATSGITELHMRANSGKSTYITFTEDSVDDRWSLGIQNGNGALRFISGTPSTGTERARITSAGDFGVGTSSPTTFGAGSILVTAAGTTTYGGFIGRTNTVTVQMWSDESAAFGIVGTRTNHPTVFTTNNNERARITSGGNFCVSATSIRSALGANTKATIKDAAIGSLGGAGTGAIDTGISINQADGGLTLLLLASRNTSAGTNTDSAMYIVRFYYDGNNAPTTTYVGGSSNFVTFGTSGSNTLTVTNSGGGNASYSWFSSR